MEKSEIAYNLTMYALQNDKICFEEKQNQHTAEQYNRKTAESIADFYNTVLANLK